MSTTTSEQTPVVKDLHPEALEFIAKSVKNPMMQSFIGRRARAYPVQGPESVPGGYKYDIASGVQALTWAEYREEWARDLPEDEKTAEEGERILSEAVIRVIDETYEMDWTKIVDPEAKSELPVWNITLYPVED